MPLDAAPPEFVSFLSDYGHVDEFVGVCKAVIVSLAPRVRVIDVTHDLPPHDVRAGALALVRAVQYLPSGIVVAIVDPGVGTQRRLVAIRVESGYMLGPDNGLLAPAVALVGGAHQVVSLTNPEYQLPAPSATFAGRDVLAPAAGHLAAGVALDALGEEVDPAGLVPGVVSLPQLEGDVIAGEVWWVDRFGNCQLNIDPDELRAHGGDLGATVEVHGAGHTRSARWVRAYADARPSELVVVVDSSGLLSLAMDRRSAAVECGLGAGSAVRLAARGAG